MISNAWTPHCKGRYPREFASPERMRSPVLNDDQLAVLIQTYTPGHNCYTSVYSFDPWERINNEKLDYSNAIIDTIFIDLDWKINPEIALYEARLVDWACRHRNISPRINFTGKKGFAIYFDLEPIDLKRKFKKPVVRTFIEYIKNKLSLKTLDKQCLDVISRISRLPNTRHHTSGLFCIPLNRDQLWHMDGIKHILDLAKNPSNTPIIIQENKIIPEMLYRIQDILINQPVDKPKIKQPVPFIQIPQQQDAILAKGSPCPGVLEIMSGVQEGIRDTSMCGLIAGLNLQMNMNYQNVQTAVLNWMNTCNPPLLYDSFTISNKVTEIMSKQYRPCTFLIRAGIRACSTCPISKK